MIRLRYYLTEMHTWHAAEAGLEFLRREWKAAGIWQDFRIGIAGQSDDWVTAFVCRELAELQWSEARRVCEPALVHLHETQRTEGGWGYSGAILADADTTSLAAFSLTRAGIEFERERAAEFLLRHHDAADGGFKTYHSDVELRDLYKNTVRAKRSFNGWCMAHAEVTAVAVVALQALGFGEHQCTRAGISYIQRMRGNDGLWRGYWSPDAFYPTYRACGLLARLGRVGEATAATLLSRQAQDGSWGAPGTKEGCPFRTALAARTLVSTGVAALDAMRAAASWLIRTQSSEGKWRSRYPFLRVPPPHVEDPDCYDDWGVDGGGTGATYVDAKGLLTSATVVGCLAALADQKP